MLSITECCKEWKQIQQIHNSFVRSYIIDHITFYRSVFEYLDYLNANPSISDQEINKTIKRIKKKSNLHGTHAKGLLNVLFKKDKDRIKKENEYYLLRQGSLLREQAKDYHICICSLRYLEYFIDDLLYFDFPISEDQLRDYQINKLFISPVSFLLDKIINYEWFSSLGTEEVWGAYQLTRSLDLKSCVYCNRTYTFSVSRKHEKITRPELDHFVSKAKNPLLALSFKNLIPSCSVCNSDLKFEADVLNIRIMNPYEENLKHQLMHFSYTPLTYEGAMGITDEIEIEIQNRATPQTMEWDQIKNQIKMFEHKIIYNEHRDIAQDLIKKRWISNNRYLELVTMPFTDFEIGIEEAYQLAFGNFYDESQFSKRPFAKFTKDIANQLNLLPD